ncbi:TolC family protein [Borrelia anserina]|uniref:Outer membrane protein tolC n=2 Tax=Borrelia anserina TaxID=143 RepID=W5SMI7_BORAN|nr:TolC family protein [Borrelia anserina]AHH08105.1 Outer membrane protein tolC [Borrelia anserina BA2]AHH08888.1 Outer membrane protein tolC [Borrelia anserina BA2]APR64647.1 transporter [Borrelia anserina Es]UPA06558.1 TolC family protein [Borrelia anserina]
MDVLLYLLFIDRIRVKGLLLIFVLLFFSYSSYAEVIIKISAEDAVSMALENSLDPKDTEYKEKIKEIYKDNSWNIFVPNIAFSSNFSRQNSFMPNMGGIGDWSLSFGVSADIAISPADFSKIRFAILEYENAKINREKATKIIKLRVLKIYNELLAFKSILDFFKSQVKSGKLTFDQVKVAYHSGLITEIDYLDAKLKYGKVQLDLDEQIIKFEETKNRLKLLLGLDVSQDFETIGELSDEVSNVSLFNEVIDVNEHLEVRELNNFFKITQLSLDDRWLNVFLPRLSLSVSYNPGSIFLGNDWGGLLNRGGGFQFSFSLTYNLTEILPFSKSFVEIWEQDCKLKILKSQIENKIREFKFNIVQKRKIVRLYESMLKHSKMNLEIAKKNYHLVFDAFNGGAVDLIKLNNIEISYKQSNLQFIKDKLNYANAVLEYQDLLD